VPAPDAGHNTGLWKAKWTGEHAQLVVMSIPPGGRHDDEDHEQILTFVSGQGSWAAIAHGRLRFALGPSSSTADVSGPDTGLPRRQTGQVSNLLSYTWR
jgi:hypothetical protein